MSEVVPFSDEEVRLMGKIVRPFALEKVDEETAKTLEEALEASFPGGRVELTEQKSMNDLIIPLFCFRHQGRRAFIR
jgi:hypothetical protein